MTDQDFLNEPIHIEWTEEYSQIEPRNTIIITQYSQQNIYRDTIMNPLYRIPSNSLYEKQSEQMSDEQILLNNFGILTMKQQLQSHSPSSPDEDQQGQKQIQQNPQTKKVQVEQIQSSETKKGTTKIDYQKNIPNYITKSCLKAMLSKTYHRKVKRICQKEQVNLKQLKDMIDNLSLTPTIGLQQLFYVLKKDSKAHQVLRKFFTWYLRKRYIIYLLQQGKMQLKNKYINCKNKLIYLRWTHIKSSILQQVII